LGGKRKGYRNRMICFSNLRFAIRVFSCVLCFAQLPVCGFAQSENQHLPELHAFLAKVKENLKSDWLLLSQYTFDMEESVRYLDKDGHVKKSEIRVFEVYPSLEEDMTYQRLISENGKPVDAKKLEEQDQKFSKKADSRARSLAKEHRSDQEQRLAKEAEESKKEREAIDDLFRIYEFALLRREIVDGHSGILIRFTPKPQYEPQTKDGKILKKVGGEALISETDYQVMRVEAGLIDDYSIGLGLLARVHQGARLIFLRRKVNNEIWLPAEFRFVGSVRALLLKQLRIESTSLFSNYKKYSVSSNFEFTPRTPSK
jgi:hypothetical protein